jgi:hypothetical protein
MWTVALTVDFSMVLSVPHLSWYKLLTLLQREGSCHSNKYPTEQSRKDGLLNSCPPHSEA